LARAVIGKLSAASGCVEWKAICTGEVFRTCAGASSE